MANTSMISSLRFNSQAVRKESHGKGVKREGGGIGELLAYAGDRKFLTYLGMALSALSQLLSFGPFVCIWLVARDLIAVAPNWSEACRFLNIPPLLLPKPQIWVFRHSFLPHDQPDRSFLFPEDSEHI